MLVRELLALVGVPLAHGGRKVRWSGDVATHTMVSCRNYGAVHMINIPNISCSSDSSRYGAIPMQ